MPLYLAMLIDYDVLRHEVMVRDHERCGMSRVVLAGIPTEESVNETVAKCNAGKLSSEDTACLTIDHLDHVVISGDRGSCAKV